ncbi:MAG: rpsT [Thermoleophilia bacterium]|nr:rpsT [Thermoleophilia bacterium]
MANIKQQKKRIGTALRQRNENLRYRSTIKTLLNKLQAAVDTGERTVAETTHKELVSLLDRAASRSVLHRNTASRKKARASRILLQEAKTDATTIRKAKKKAAPVTRKPKADAKKPAAKKAAPKKADKPVAEEAPVEEVVEETPAVEEAPVAEAPAEEAVAEETPADETPVEAAPVAEETPDDAPAAVGAEAPADDAKD